MTGELQPQEGRSLPENMFEVLQGIIDLRVERSENKVARDKLTQLDEVIREQGKRLREDLKETEE